MLFTDFLSDLAAQLPFGVTFNVKPSKRSIGKKVEIIEGIEIALIKDLSVSEKWFEGIVSELNQSKTVELQVEMKLLGVALEEYANKNAKEIVANFSETVKKDFAKSKDKKIIESLSDAVQLLFNSASFLEELEDEKLSEMYVEFMNSDEYSSFIMKHTEDYKNISSLSKLVQSSHSVKWVVVTFFLMSRFDESWDFSDTATLSTEELDAVYDVFLVEKNKGVPLAETLVEALDDVDDTEALKKS